MNDDFVQELADNISKDFFSYLREKHLFVAKCMRETSLPIEQIEQFFNKKWFGDQDYGENRMNEEKTEKV